MRYNPFRVTPYQLKVQRAGNSGEDEEPCCLALAERIISGYEGMMSYFYFNTDVFALLLTENSDVYLCSVVNCSGFLNPFFIAAPRIPMDKRIFTTTHSPGCVFLEVDERSVHTHTGAR